MTVLLAHRMPEYLCKLCMAQKFKCVFLAKPVFHVFTSPILFPLPLYTYSSLYSTVTMQPTIFTLQFSDILNVLYLRYHIVDSNAAATATAVDDDADYHAFFTMHLCTFA